jgi:hypothetical protein
MASQVEDEEDVRLRKFLTGQIFLLASGLSAGVVACIVLSELGVPAETNSIGTVACCIAVMTFGNFLKLS